MSSFAVRLRTGVTGGSPADRGEERWAKSPLFRAFGRVGDGSGDTGPGSCNVVPMGFVGLARDVDGTSWPDGDKKTACLLVEGGVELTPRYPRGLNGGWSLTSEMDSSVGGVDVSLLEAPLESDPQVTEVTELEEHEFTDISLDVDDELRETRFSTLGCRWSGRVQDAGGRDIQRRRQR